jgi:hypothetical protein
VGAPRYRHDTGRQCEATETRLIDEPLTDNISPVGGGSFFVPPGLRTGDDYYATAHLTPAKQTRSNGGTALCPCPSQPGVDRSRSERGGSSAIP